MAHPVDVGCLLSTEMLRDVLITVTLQHSTRANEHPGFVLRLILDGSVIRYEPDFCEFEVVFLNIYDTIIKSVGVVPRVESKLYSDWVNFCCVCVNEFFANNFHVKL